MDEERRCQDPHRLCVNNCGFFGSPATNDLCSKCYRDLRLTEEQAEKAVITVDKSLAAPSPSSPVTSSPDVPPVELAPHSEKPRLLCANDCGFFGSPVTDDLCSKCYREIHKEKTNSIMADVSNSGAAAAVAAPAPAPAPAAVSTIESSAASVSTTAAIEEPKRPTGPSRCARPTCNKKVGVIGFKCKCGDVYCSNHRLPEKHECSFDYKSLGREKIEKANPVVKAEKLEKI